MHQVVRQVERWSEVTEETDLFEVPHAYGMVTKYSSYGDIKICYTESFNYDLNDSESLSTGTEGQDSVWVVEGIIVEDEDGDELDSHSLGDLLTGDFISIDYSFLHEDEIIDIDVDENSDMELFTLQIDNKPNIRFNGELIGDATSSDNSALGSQFSGNTGRWTELYLYKTAGGRYICHQIGRTSWAGERDRFTGEICENIQQVTAFFGFRWLAKDLYSNAEIDTAVDVE